MKSVKREKQNPNMISFNRELGECSYRWPEGKILFILLDSCSNAPTFLAGSNTRDDSSTLKRDSRLVRRFENSVNYWGY